MTESPLERLKKPSPKRASAKVYKPDHFQRMLEWAHLKAESHEREALLPFLALCGLCFMRTGEVVRLYNEEPVICWSDILWDRKLVHVRGEVAKETRRSDDERFMPFSGPFEKAMVSFMDRKEGRCVEILHRQFSEQNGFGNTDSLGSVRIFRIMLASKDRASGKKKSDDQY